jgi:hypothetical protein
LGFGEREREIEFGERIYLYGGDSLEIGLGEFGTGDSGAGVATSESELVMWIS